MQKSFFLFPVMMLCMVAGCAQTPKSNSSSKGKKILIVYYSYSGNTKEIAGQIQKTAGGDLVEIEPVKAYPSEYTACTEQAKKEIESGYKPELKSKVKDIASYDIIFVGTPNWWSTVAPPITTFLSDNDLSGKTIVPFCTHGGGGKSRCFSDMEKLAPKSNFLEGFVVSGNRVKSAQAEVDQWLKKINITE